MEEDTKAHWEHVYREKSPEQMSWTQETPQLSINLIKSLNLPKTANIIDLGGGDSKLVDHLLQEGYTNITVVDISIVALEKAQLRLGEKSKIIKWVVSDIINFVPQEKYELWHDRAAFHFLTTIDQINRYLSITANAVTGYMVLGVFSETGPEKCSGLPVKRYSEQLLEEVFAGNFSKIACVKEQHITPFQTSQDFVFCTFRRHC
ncbi:class I SAM-dependent methyltransferase [Mucilaginibacter aquariorum]|uniref:Class I SAM-dependent methyltransferase n=1 Tax=Mucilaginibacter aquariorum TaxID=2967225 RepID=A0ABT1T356_9SPHI|nr:class I SAM-dependent methyltransferase [Mucilaginibacter aquariorum]MCQ6959034.1 class I SAM-dependent methyltransferase [Mucilaginibacter aquariorum]